MGGTVFGRGETPAASATRIRWSGLAALAAGVLLVLAEIFALGLLGGDAEAAVLSAPYTLYSILLTAAAILLPLGLVGLYARQSETSGFLGLAGFFVAFAATVVVAGLFWVGSLLIPTIVQLSPGAAPEIFNAEATPGFSASVIAFAVGWLLFGLAALQARVHPPVAVILLIIGAVVAVIPLPLSTVVLGVAIAWLGYGLFRSIGDTGEESSRPSRAR